MYLNYYLKKVVAKLVRLPYNKIMKSNTNHKHNNKGDIKNEKSKADSHNDQRSKSLFRG